MRVAFADLLSGESSSTHSTRRSGFLYVGGFDASNLPPFVAVLP
jgi:hypothetical protein